MQLWYSSVFIFIFQSYPPYYGSYSVTTVTSPPPPPPPSTSPPVYTQIQLTNVRSISFSLLIKKFFVTWYSGPTIISMFTLRLQLQFCQSCCQSYIHFIYIIYVNFTLYINFLCFINMSYDYVYLHHI